MSKAAWFLLGNLTTAAALVLGKIGPPILLGKTRDGWF